MPGGRRADGTNLHPSEFVVVGALRGVIGAGHEEATWWGCHFRLAATLGAKWCSEGVCVGLKTV